VGLDSLSQASFPRLVAASLYALAPDLITAFLPIVDPVDAWNELVGIVSEIGVSASLDSLTSSTFPRLVASVLYNIDIGPGFSIVNTEDSWNELVGTVAEVGLGSNPFTLALVVKLTRDLHLSS
jgi:hypothetical protein